MKTLSCFAFVHSIDSLDVSLAQADSLADFVSVDGVLCLDGHLAVLRVFCVANVHQGIVVVRRPKVSHFVVLFLRKFEVVSSFDVLPNDSDVIVAIGRFVEVVESQQVQELVENFPLQMKSSF